MKKINKILGGGLAFMLSFTSCSDDILNVVNPNQPPGAENLSDPVSRAGAVNAIYKPMQSKGAYGRWQYLLEDFSSDELSPPATLANDESIQSIIDYNLNNDAEATTFYWESCFGGVRAANDFLGTVDLNDSSLFSQIAEARFLRGHYLFLLASRFGGLPINTSTSPQSVARLTLEETYDFIIEDFKYAEANLLPIGEQEKGRPTNESASAYLGKIYLFSISPSNFKNDPATYDLAFDALDKVKSYSLVSEYEDNFNTSGEYNAESLFEIDFQRQDANAIGFWDANLPDGVADVTMRSVDYSSWGNAIPSSTQINEYEVLNADEIEVDSDIEPIRDPRYDFTFWNRGDSYGNGRVWGSDPDANNTDFGAPAAGTLCSRKFSEYIETDGSIAGSGINFRVIRYADVLLMKAEAALFKTSPDMRLAIDLMNEVRARPSVNMDPYPLPDAGFPCSTIDETFDALVHERRVELALEGKRVLDIGRWGMDVELLRPSKPNYNSNKRFYPIPNSELLSNPRFGADNPQ